MVRVVRTPQFARGVFSGNELSGWAEGVAYAPSSRRRKRRKRRQPTADSAVTDGANVPAVTYQAVPVRVGVSIS